MQDIKFKLTLCDGPSCIHSQSKQLRVAIEAELEKHGIAENTEIHLSGCLGMCKKGPVLIVNPGYVMYGNVMFFQLGLNGDSKFFGLALNTAWPIT